MIVQMDIHGWQVLRKLLREGVVSGRELRLNMHRRTANGQFLTDMHELGLISCVQDAPDIFARKYELTELGKHTAEYGEYEIEFSKLKAIKRK